ncbi:TonB-dependent receptor [Jiulongibacter sp. NS-SX5]|uniref:TonB-dependent receptor n=1 Tax=Jiulongibacter sp. NS-SX5 TaxID=3463854 RepID=UPI004059BFE5
MSLFNRLSFLFFLVPFLVTGQDNCSIKLHGQAIDEVTGKPLPFASIYLESNGQGTSADEEGFFAFDGLCAGTTHLKISHVSCEPLRIFISVKRDTVLNLYLHHHEELMDEVLVHGDARELTIENSSTIDKDLISQRSNLDLTKVIEEIAGVSSLNTGSGISKPVIHGMYGNRITMLNNGVAQAGQQWGNDHAPEIDAFAADHISVIKGVGALAYQGNSLGGVVLIEPGSISTDPHLHGQLNSVFETNGNGATLNLELEKGKENHGFRATLTSKKIGDRSTPDYYLNNSGKEELNGSLFFEFDRTKKWNKSVYLSTFNSTIGILRGAHIGNLTDLKLSFNREVPFYTEDDFSYVIDAPKQKVKHLLAKLSTERQWGQNRKLSLSYAAQVNNRKEFDVRRSGRSDIPALSLLQLNQQLDAVYDFEAVSGVFLKTGVHGSLTDNTNQPETGILPLIPDYYQSNEAAFITLQKEQNKWLYELGGRLLLNQYNVVTISRDIPRVIERFQHDYTNVNVAGGFSFQPIQPISLHLNTGYIERAPAINELYSAGLHQGVSSLEYGNANLNKEKSVKLTLSGDFNFQDKLFIQLIGYAQRVNDFIYLKPAEEPQLTIRGAFPLFNYSQTDAFIHGFDGLVSFEPKEFVRYIGKFAVLKGQNITEGIPLVYMAPNNIHHQLKVSLPSVAKLQNTNLAFGCKTVFEQRNYLNDQDFVPPPSTYTLFDAEIHTVIPLSQSGLHFSIRGENLFNKSYRDYMNRQRYFADELGRNISIRVQWEF